jgi:DNA polymerase-3 subunit chi
MFDGNDPEAVQSARDRWKTYKADGHSVTYWRQTDRGGWEKAG